MRILRVGLGCFHAWGSRHFTGACGVPLVLALSTFGLGTVLPSLPQGPATPGGGVLEATAFAGGDAGGMINACLRALGASGGVCDARGLASGIPLSASENMFEGVDHPFTLLLGAFTISIAVPQIVRVRGAIVGSGPDTVLYYQATNGTLLTFSYPDSGLAMWVQAGLFSVYLAGMGANLGAGSGGTVGLQIGPPVADGNGAAGLSIQNVGVRQFGTNVRIGNHAYSIHFDNDFFENAATDLDLPAGVTETGEMIALSQTFIADAGVGINEASDGYEVECSACSLDYNGVALVLGKGTFTSVNSHWEGSQLQPFVRASGGSLIVMGGQWVSTAPGGTWPAYIEAEGDASVSVSASDVGSFGSTLAAFVDWSSAGQLEVAGNIFRPTGNVMAVASGFRAGSSGQVQRIFRAGDGASEGIEVGSLRVGRGPILVGASGTGGYLVTDSSPIIRAPLLENATLDSAVVAGSLQLPDRYEAGPATILQPRSSGTLATEEELPSGRAFAIVGPRWLKAGTCLSLERTFVGADTLTGVVASPETDPGANLVWNAFVSSPSQVTLRVCALADVFVHATEFNIWLLYWADGHPNAPKLEPPSPVKRRGGSSGSSAPSRGVLRGGRALGAAGIGKRPWPHQ